MDNPILITEAPERENGQAKQPCKRTYEKPQVIYSAPLEAMAVACLDDYNGPGKASPEVPFSCANLNS